MARGASAADPRPNPRHAAPPLSFQNVRRRFSLYVAVLAVSGCGWCAAAVSPALASVVSPPKRVLALTRVRVVLTTASLTDRLTPKPDLHFKRSGPPQGPDIHVDERIRFQRMTGFGAGMTDSSAWLIYDELTPGARATLMNELFGPHGIHLNFMRVPIGASDFTVTGVPYSYDDMPSGQSDPLLRHFSIRHDGAYVIPALRQMLARNHDVDLLASLWSAPPWMKANHAFDNLFGAGSLLPGDYGALARYFVKFIRAYRHAGVPIDAVTAQNEPLSETAYPGMELPASQEAGFIGLHLRPALNAAGLGTKIYGIDGGGDLPYAHDLLSTAARSALDGIAWHCYGGMGSASVLHRQYPFLDQIVSECSPGIIPYSAAEAAISATRNWASVVALWNLALDPASGPVQAPSSGCQGCTGVVTVSERTHQAYLGANYYQLGQVSKYVQPGAVRIASDRFAVDFRTPTGAYGVTEGLDDVAFLNPDGTKVLVADDTSRATIRFTVAWHGLAFRYALKPGATVSFIWK